MRTLEENLGDTGPEDSTPQPVAPRKATPSRRQTDRLTSIQPSSSIVHSKKTLSKYYCEVDSPVSGQMDMSEKVNLHLA